MLTLNRNTAANRRLAKKRVQWLIELSASYQLLCWVDSLVLRNPLLRQAPKRYASPSHRTSIKQIDTHADRFSQKTNLSTDTRTAQILCVSIFKFVFRADRSATTQAK
jgi:hypothetical protein